MLDDTSVAAGGKHPEAWDELRWAGFGGTQHEPQQALPGERGCLRPNASCAVQPALATRPERQQVALPRLACILTPFSALHVSCQAGHPALMVGCSVREPAGLLAWLACDAAGLTPAEPKGRAGHCDSSGGELSELGMHGSQ